MFNPILFRILMIFVGLDLILGAVLVIFMFMARRNLERQFNERRFELQMLRTAQTANSSEEAALELGISPDEFRAFCETINIDTPEVRIEKREKVERRKQEEMERIMEEEAAWRAEQERIAEQRQRQQEEMARRRKDRLRKFGL